ncbi:MAG: hypothetical protein L3K18_04100 [Thermoplasmata archaeon]|nr:hypothetical protein [Thermoplasmata archaeon]MCI4356312.1 hypothetical protein [Thermoplasmata archaeon]
MRRAWWRPSRPHRSGLGRWIAVGAIAALLVVPVAQSFGKHPWADAGARIAADSVGWSVLPPPAFAQPYGRAYAAVGFDPLAGAGILFGGRGTGGTVLGDTWANDGDFPGRWSNETDTAPNPPPPLTNASVAYDAADGYFLLFGGRLANGTQYGGTWELEGFHTWVRLAFPPLGSPPPQAGAGMVYDPADGSVVLVSSSNAGVSTWTFRDEAWTLVASSGGPSARTSPAVTYDPIDRAVFLFGGSAASGPLNDTWELAGGSWTRVGSGPAPPASLTPRVAFDPRGSGMLLFGGGSAASTWEFHQGRWGVIATPGPTTPPARTGAALYYDSVVGYDVLFGGLAADGRTALSDAWGWAVPPASGDPTVSPVPVPLPELALVGGILVGPVVLAWFLRRRPPRLGPVSVPSASSSPGI